MVHWFILWSVAHPTIPHPRISQQSRELTAYVSSTSKTYEEIAYPLQLNTEYWRFLSEIILWPTQKTRMSFLGFDLYYCVTNTENWHAFLISSIVRTQHTVVFISVYIIVQSTQKAGWPFSVWFLHYCATNIEYWRFLSEIKIEMNLHNHGGNTLKDVLWFKMWKFWGRRRPNASWISERVA